MLPSENGDKAKIGTAVMTTDSITQLAMISNPIPMHIIPLFYRMGKGWV